MARIKKPISAGDVENTKPKEKVEVLHPEQLSEKEIEISREANASEKEPIVEKELREKIEKTDIDDSLKIQASAHAQDIKALEDEKKINKLMELAKAKGIVYAVHVAKKMDDPYILDKLHDTLAKEGYYKNLKL